MLPMKNQESEAMAKVPVNGRVLQWAREMRGLNLDAAAELLGVSASELHAYESGQKQPLVGFLRHMSSKYRINFTSLLMPDPLPPTKQPTDHRVRFGKKPLSIDTLVAIEEVTDALDIFEDIASETKRLIPKLRIGKATLQDNPAQVAARERTKFGVSFSQQRSWRSIAEARVRWRERIEERGIFTYMVKLPPEELSGFSILRDEALAAICVNDTEPTEGAKIFTLFHEYCHLLLRNAGISDEKDSNQVERFCNRFAAAFLIPKSNLIETISESVQNFAAPHEFSDSDVRRFSNIFRVSNRAMALRLERTGLAPTGFYAKRTAPWDVPVEPSPVEQTSKKQQPSQIRITLKRVGRLHASVVLEAVKRHAINSFDASELIGLRPSTFSKVKAELG
jgi:Zn-dependent peptidase ImmA (M78 family)